MFIIFRFFFDTLFLFIWFIQSPKIPYSKNTSVKAKLNFIKFRLWCNKHFANQCKWNKDRLEFRWNKWNMCSLKFRIYFIELAVEFWNLCCSYIYLIFFCFYKIIMSFVHQIIAKDHFIHSVFNSLVWELKSIRNGVIN